MAQRTRRGDGGDSGGDRAPGGRAPHEDGVDGVLAVDPHLLRWYEASTVGGDVAPRRGPVAGGGGGGAAAADVPLPPPRAYGQAGSPGAGAAAPPSFLTMQRLQAARLGDTPYIGHLSTALSTHLVIGADGVYQGFSSATLGAVAAWPSAAAPTWPSTGAQAVPLPPPRGGVRPPPALPWSPGWPYGVPPAAEP